MTYNVHFNIPNLGSLTVPVTAGDMDEAQQLAKESVRGMLGPLMADAIGDGSVSTRTCGG